MNVTETVTETTSENVFCENTACEQLADLKNPEQMEKRKAVQRRLWAKLNQLTREARRLVAIPGSTNDKLRNYYEMKGVKLGDYFYYNELISLGLRPRPNAEPLLYWGKKNEKGFWEVVQKFRKSDCEGVKVENL